MIPKCFDNWMVRLWMGLNNALELWLSDCDKELFTISHRCMAQIEWQRTLKVWMLKIHHTPCVVLWLVGDGSDLYRWVVEPKTPNQAFKLAWWLMVHSFLICRYAGPFCKEKWRSAVKALLTAWEPLQTASKNIPFCQQKKYCRQQTWMPKE